VHRVLIRRGRGGMCVGRSHGGGSRSDGRQRRRCRGPIPLQVSSGRVDVKGRSIGGASLDPADGQLAIMLRSILRWRNSLSSWDSTRRRRNILAISDGRQRRRCRGPIPLQVSSGRVDVKGRSIGGASLDPADGQLAIMLRSILRWRNSLSSWDSTRRRRNILGSMLRRMSESNLNRK
jgi:hypothetical protein